MPPFLEGVKEQVSHKRIGKAPLCLAKETLAKSRHSDS